VAGQWGFAECFPSVAELHTKALVDTEGHVVALSIAGAKPCGTVFDLDQTSMGAERTRRDSRVVQKAALGVAFCLATSLCFTACSTLPEDGPSAYTVAKHASSTAKRSYSLIDVDYRVAQIIDANPSSPLTSLRTSPQAGPSDLIAVGDTLAVAIYQPGGGVAMQVGEAPGPGSGQDQGSSQQSTLRAVVDRAGAIEVPFGGNVSVVNLTPSGAASAIRRALRGKIADPQVIVTSVTSPRNSVIVIGEVRAPGRFPLGANADKLLDALAAAGGPTKPALDLALTVVRGDQSATISVATLLQNPDENIRLAPQDQIRVTASPRKVDVFGAVGRGSQIPIEDDTLTLAGALSRIGGLNPLLADAQSVLVFRFERPDVARALGVSFPDIPGLKGVPIIYRVNLRDPSGYFIANRFDVVADDLIYVPTASSAELQKFLNIVNAAGQFIYDASVTKSLGL
jgi:polysaccharide biosynthesis/export protein